MPAEPEPEEVEEGLELALETSRREASLALARDALVLEDGGSVQAHASDLLPRLERLLERLGIAGSARPLPLATLFVGTGPGSYTGLRVGIATAQGLARATGASLHGVPSFAALAWAELVPGEEGTVVADARAGHFYCARYRRLASDIEELDAPRALDARALAERCRAPGPILTHPGLVEAAGLALGPERVRLCGGPRATAVLALGRARLAAGAAASQALEPLYLRPFGPRASG